MTIELDTWTLSRNTAFLMQPLTEALARRPEINLRRIVAAGGRELPWTGPTVPVLAPPVPVCVHDLARFTLRYPAGRQAVASFYRDTHRIVHVTMPSPYDLLYLKIARRHGATILITVHDATQHPGEERAALRMVMDHIYGMADHLIAVSHFVGDALRSSARFAAPVHVVPGGLLEDLGSPLPPRIAPVGRPLRLLFHGRIKHYKGVDLLLDAIETLNRRAVPVSLTIVGSGDTDGLEERTAQLPNVMTVLRWTSDAEREAFYADHDVNVLPYREASQSGVALRGLFAAIPTVATPVGALGEQLCDGENAIFADAVSGDAIANAIERLAIHADYAALSRGAAAAAARQNAPAITDRWLELYQRIASRQN